MNRLSGKSAVVTGGASGIGLAIAILFAEEGARVTVGDVNERALADLADEPALDEERAEFVHADVSTVGGASKLVEAAQRRFGGPNALVCNAGITSVMAVERLSEDEWDRVQRNNVKSVYTTPWRCARLAATG